MIKLLPIQLHKIKEHTLQCFPEEMCGILTSDDFIPCTNAADEPEKHFKIPPAELAQHTEFKAIVHSHIRNIKRPELLDTRTPSLADLKGQRDTGVPWLIVATEGAVVTPPLEIPRDRSLPYVGRSFIWFVADCYTLVQDYYANELGIALKDHKEDLEFKELRRFDGIFDMYVEEYGFIEHSNINDMQNGDLLLLDNAGSKRNHLGIYHNGDVIHQDAVSVQVPFSTFIGRINKVLRYAS